METLLIGLKNEKALQLLKDLEELDVIELIKNNGHNSPAEKNKLSSLKDAVISKMNDAEIELQSQSIRNEWQRDI